MSIVKAALTGGVVLLSEHDLLKDRFSPDAPNLLVLHEVGSLHPRKINPNLLAMAKVDGSANLPAVFFFLPLDDPAYVKQSEKDILKLITEIQASAPQASVGLKYNATQRFFPPDMDDVGDDHPDMPKAIEYLREQIDAYERNGIHLNLGTPHGYGRKRKRPNNRDSEIIQKELRERNIQSFIPFLKRHLNAVFDHVVRISCTRNELTITGLPKDAALDNPETYRQLPDRTLVQLNFPIGQVAPDEPLAIRSQEDQPPLYSEIRRMSSEQRDAPAKGPVFCPAFWVLVTLDEQTASSCCYARKPYLWSKYFPQTSNIQQHLNSDKYREARWKMVHGKEGEVCPMTCPIFYRYRKKGDVFGPDQFQGQRWSNVPYDELPKAGLTPFQENYKNLCEAILHGRYDLEGLHPMRVTVRLGTHCNLRCKMCAQIQRPLMKQDPRILEQILQELPYLRFIKITGGEPFIFPFARTLCEQADQFPELRLHATTNGVLLEDDFWYEKIPRHFHQLDISVDATTKDVYDRIRIKGDFEKVLRVTRELTSRPTEKNLTLSWDFCTQKDNYKQLVDFANLAAEHGVHSINYQMMGVPRNFQSGVGPEDDIRFSRDRCIETLELMNQAEQRACELGVRITDQVRPNIFARYPDLAASQQEIFPTRCDTNIEDDPDWDPSYLA
ncbi:MAG: radical SAM protein [Phycisphaerae bacterium]|nr:radical SAM protein [Phycisphaerae bacterium]